MLLLLSSTVCTLLIKENTDNQKTLGQLGQFSWLYKSVAHWLIFKHSLAMSTLKFFLSIFILIFSGSSSWWWPVVDGSGIGGLVGGSGPRRIRTSYSMEPDYTRAFYTSGLPYSGANSVDPENNPGDPIQYGEQKNYSSQPPPPPPPPSTMTVIEDHPPQPPPNYQHHHQQQPQHRQQQPQQSYSSSPPPVSCRKKSTVTGYHQKGSSRTIVGNGGGGGTKDKGESSLEECIRCHMRPAEASRFTKCQAYFREGLNNYTKAGEGGDKYDGGDKGENKTEEEGAAVVSGGGGNPGGEDGALVTCCQLARFMRCSAPLVMRACRHCALAAFVRQYRPHLELCHLVATIQCPMAEGRLGDEL